MPAKKEMTIEQKLKHIQLNLKANKSRRNSFGKYSYRSAEDILEALKPHLDELDCIVKIDEKIISEMLSHPVSYKSESTIHNFEPDSLGEDDDLLGGDDTPKIKTESIETSHPIIMIESKATLIDGKECEISATAIVGVDINMKGMATAQQFGATSSYGKKYALGNLFLIDDTQDPDATNTHGKTSTPAKPAKKSTGKAPAAKPAKAPAKVPAKQLPSLPEDKLQAAIDYVKSGADASKIIGKYSLTAEQKKAIEEASK